jgi:Phosphoglycerate kinase
VAVFTELQWPMFCDVSRCRQELGIIDNLIIIIVRHVHREDVTNSFDCRPFVVIIGGAKVRDKIGVLTEMVKRADKVLIGGRMAYTFLASQNVAIGNTHIEHGSFDLAKGVIEDAKVQVRVQLVVCSKTFAGSVLLHSPGHMLHLVTCSGVLRLYSASKGINEPHTSSRLLRAHQAYHSVTAGSPIPAGDATVRVHAGDTRHLISDDLRARSCCFRLMWSTHMIWSLKSLAARGHSVPRAAVLRARVSQMARTVLTLAPRPPDCSLAP